MPSFRTAAAARFFRRRVQYSRKLYPAARFWMNSGLSSCARWSLRAAPEKRQTFIGCALAADLFGRYFPIQLSSEFGCALELVRRFIEPGRIVRAFRKARASVVRANAHQKKVKIRRDSPGLELHAIGDTRAVRTLEITVIGVADQLALAIAAARESGTGGQTRHQR